MNDENNNAIKRHRKNNQPWGFSKNPASAENARPKKVYVVAAAESWNLLNATLDSRTRLGKLYQSRTDALIKSLGRKPTLPQLSLIEQAVRLSLLADLGWAECLKSGTLRTPLMHESPAFISYIKVAREIRIVYSELFPWGSDVPSSEEMAMLLREAVNVMDITTNTFIKKVD